MIGQAPIAIARILATEGGWSDDPHDNGGPTNKGITIGTLRQLHIDVDGDGDTDLADLRALPTETAIRVYKVFYWDMVMGDYLPAGLDYVLTDFAVNSGPIRAAKMLQTILGGLKVDGHIGPKTLAAVAGRSVPWLISEMSRRRLAYLERLDDWPRYRKGWSRRVSEVERDALADYSKGAAK